MLTTQKTVQDYINQIVQDREDCYYGKYVITFNRSVTLIRNRYTKNIYNVATVKLVVQEKDEEGFGVVKLVA